ncbi:mRNA decay activator protein ZFP36L2 [Nothobranchius furzeri]|uniref:mRNA decay activator protein ZFP36 n=1 Tax=Nothobranchius furzeri TaxID=105023 RepID=A0A1A8VGI7_NOTFU|nr:ZFP36 ring finger protein-like 2 [Nothobranchius furzeri]
MKEAACEIWGKVMSATVLSAFYDMDMLFKDTSMNMNALHINSMLERKAVGAPVPAAGSGGSFTPGFYRRNSTSNLEVMNSGDRYSLCCYSGETEDAPSTTSIMNKGNRFRDRAYSESGERGVLQQKPGAQINSTRYKTELCRPFEENGSCKYGEKCQFAHGFHELRSLSRHPKYKTEPCRTFHTIGFCPYGPRCHFIHNADERRPAPAANANVRAAEPRSAREGSGYDQQLSNAHRDRPKLHHSLSFSGFSTHLGLDSPLLHSPTSRTPPPPMTASTPSFYDDVLSPSSGSCIGSAFPFPGQDLRAMLAPLAAHTPGGYNDHSTGALYRVTRTGPPSPPTYNHLQTLRRLSESPVFEPPPCSPDSLSDRESYASGSNSSSGSLSGSESPGPDAGRRLPIFSRLSISDD